MTKRGFTIMELMIVVVVMGIIAAWGVPQYGRSINRARARTAMNNLVMIHAANLIYLARNGNNCTADNACTDVGEINTMNGANTLNIVEGGVDYACGDGGTTCTGTADNASFTVTLTLTTPIQDNNGNPVCAPAANCP